MFCNVWYRLCELYFTSVKVRKDILRAKFSYFSGICCNQSFITARNEVSGKVIFLQVSVILLTGGGCVWGCVSGIHTPPRQTPPGRPPGQTPPWQTPPRADIPPVNRMTDTCKNITLPETSLRAVIND